MLNTILAGSAANGRNDKATLLLKLRAMTTFDS
jgi:hypothetical protein